MSVKLKHRIRHPSEYFIYRVFDNGQYALYDAYTLHTMNTIRRSLHWMSTVLLFLFGFFLPTQFGKHFFLPFSYLSGIRIDYLAPTLYTIDLVIIALITTHLTAYRRMMKGVPAQLILFLTSLTLWYSYSREISLYQYARILEVLAVFAIIRAHRTQPTAVLLGIVSSSVIELALALNQFIMKSSIDGLFYYLGERTFTLSTIGIAKISMSGVELLRAYGTFSHPNSLAGFYLLIYAFVLFQSKPTWTRTLLLAVAPLLIFLSFSKVAMLGFALVSVKYIVVRYRMDRDHCMVCIGAKVLALMIPIAIVFRGVSDPLSAPIRMQLMHNAVVLVQHHALTGVGLGAYVIAQQYFPAQLVGSFGQPVHNIFLLMISEVGIIIPIWLMVWGGRFLWSHRHNTQLIACIFAVCFTGLFDHYWLTLIQNTLLMTSVFALLESK